MQDCCREELQHVLFGVPKTAGLPVNNSIRPDMFALPSKSLGVRQHCLWMLNFIAKPSSSKQGP